VTWINVGRIHTLPEDEKDLHSLCGGCVCGPRANTEDGVLLIVHNAMDGRDLTERAAVLKLTDTGK
jgi:hypothetical protein